MAASASRQRWFEGAALLAILLLALWLRLDGVGFGLPALNDPDEPLFVGAAIDMLQKKSLNPGWFGHPGTTTLYSLALVIAGVGGAGIATGRFADADAFAAAVFADPGVIMIPARLLMVVGGVACVWLTYRLGVRLGGRLLGLVAAAFLAVNAVHIEYSQLVRTDVQATVFMLLAALAALTIAETGQWRAYLLAGLCTGLACATKWPSAAIGVAVVGAALLRPRSEGGALRGLALYGAMTLVTLFAVSPFLLLDYPTLLANLSGEARPLHPGATGGGPLANFLWYAANPLLSSLGVAGLVLAAGGLFFRGERRWTFVILPFCLAFLLLIAVQSLRWERWILPLLPFAALAAARALGRIAELLPPRRAGWALALATLLLMLPMAGTARIEAAERRHDTRQIASAWLRANAAPGSSILVENAAFDLLAGPWRLRFPLGSAGCVDARALMAGHAGRADIEGKRSGAIIDLGHVDPAQLESCRADFLVLTNHIRYRAGGAAYAGERARYDELLARARLRFTARAFPGESSGPTVQVFELVDRAAGGPRPDLGPAEDRDAAF